MGRFKSRRREKESDFARLERSIANNVAFASFGFCNMIRTRRRENPEVDRRKKEEGRFTVMRLKMLSRKTSSSASDLRISRSVEILMRIVRAE